jgi:hypothetical protein
MYSLSSTFSRKYIFVENVWFHQVSQTLTLLCLCPHTKQDHDPRSDVLEGDDQNFYKQGWGHIHNSTEGSQCDQKALHHQDWASRMNSSAYGFKNPGSKIKMEWRGKSNSFDEKVDLCILTQTLEGHGFMLARKRDLGNLKAYINLGEQMDASYSSCCRRWPFNYSPSQNLAVAWILTSEALTYRGWKFGLAEW